MSVELFHITNYTICKLNYLPPRIFLANEGLFVPSVYPNCLP